jgi:hypothetical protein
MRQLTAHALAELQALARELTITNGREHGQGWALRLAAEMGTGPGVLYRERGPFIVEIDGRPCTELVPGPAEPVTYRPSHRQGQPL